MRALFASLAVTAGAVLALLPVASCDVPQVPQTTYYETTILPILSTSCAHSPTGSGCHVVDAKGNALGNLDVTSYTDVTKRRDLLLNYGPFGRPSLLTKTIPPYSITVKAFDDSSTGGTTITTDIKHAGGPVLSPSDTGYLTLSQWMANGATENNSGAPPTTTTRLPCTDVVPPADPTTGWNPNSADPTAPDYQQFVSNVIPVIQNDGCNAGNCHGTLANEFYLTCGTSDVEQRWNYFSALGTLSETPNQSEIVRRPLAPSLGGTYHEGGVIWQTTSDSDYQAVLSWVTAAEPSFMTLVTQTETNNPNFGFFAHRIQPLLVKKGCMMLQCHSAAMFHEYRLRGGTGGSFSLAATQKNYALTLAQMGMDDDDVDSGRLIQKNFYRKDVDPLSGGITHRGGALLEDFGASDNADGGLELGTVTLATGALCDAGAGAPGYAAPPYDYDNQDLDTIPVYCMLREWHARERATSTMTSACNGGPCNLAPLSGIVYVAQSGAPMGDDQVNDFDTYIPGATIHILPVTEGPTGGVVVSGADMDVTAGCGLGGGAADIRRPAVSWDAMKIAFAARTSASAPFQVYEMNADGSGCAPHAGINAVTGTGNGLLVHNFDPKYAPPNANGVMPIVFASTRGVDTTQPYAMNYGYSGLGGPQRQPFDPTKPNPNLWVYEPNASMPGQFDTRQMTFQLNQERWPNFMNDGRLIFSATKRAPNFYQVALRRQNLDGGDYHPLYAQRGSIGMPEATQVAELANKNFAAIFSQPGWEHLGGALVVFNRSIGIDFYSTNMSDYLIDPTVFNPASMSSPEPQFFLHSLSFVQGNGTFVDENGQPIGTLSPASYTSSGVFRSPAALPSGHVLVSFAATTNPSSFNLTSYGLYDLDPVGQTLTAVNTGVGGGIVDAVAIYGRYNHGTFVSALDEPNGNTTVVPGAADAQVFVLDMTVLGSLLFQNTPTGRPVEDINAQGQDVGLDSFDVYEDMPPDVNNVTTFGAGGSNVVMDMLGPSGQVYVQRRKLGTVSLQGDKSTYFSIPGGLPVVLHLPNTTVSTANNYPRWQREAMTFYPGERAHQSFQQTFFNGLCALCHGSISGRPIDAALNPDLLTQASQVDAYGQTGSNNYNIPPNLRASPIGPPFTP